LFRLPLGRDVDLGGIGQDWYVLTRGLSSPLGEVLAFRQGRPRAEFRPNLQLMHPRQLVASNHAIYVLDRAGRRLLALDPGNGALKLLLQFRDRRAVSAVWSDAAGERLLLAGKDTLYFVHQPEAPKDSDQGSGPWRASDQILNVSGTVPLARLSQDEELVLKGPQPHDLDWLEGLRGLSMPLAGAAITSRDFQMPGAPRHYRFGVHEGIDFYGHTVGVTVDRNTSVRASADGTVIRALTDYAPLTRAQADAWAAISRDLGYTPPEVLDGYRGMQLWIDHGGGLVTRYAHLGSIAPGIVEGVKVSKGDVIATVGNSGTPASVSSQSEEVHLHFELWLGDHNVGQFLRPIEAREWLEKILR
jgi:murein DD-endopeptidase MepM/ murein hydrolase activator NlpD